MSVNNASDAINDLFALADQRQREQDRTTTSSRDGNSDNGDNANVSTSEVETQFSQLLKGRLTSNIVFTRLDQQLSLPQQVHEDRAKAPIIDRRDDLGDDRNVDAFDPTDTLEHTDHAIAAAPIADTRDQQVVRPDNTNSNARNDSAAANDDGAPAQAARNAGKGGENGAQNNGGNQQNTSAADKAAQRTVASGQLQTNLDTPELLDVVVRQANPNAQRIAASVTDEGAQITSLPQASLGARAAVDAATSSKTNANAGILEQAALDGEAAEAADAGANNIFNRLKAQAGAAGKQGTAQAQAQGGANTADGQAAGQAAGQAQNNANPQLALGIQRSAAANAQVSSLTGTQQSAVTVDGASGSTATLGENNSVQNRSAASPTAAASRPPPVPAHVVADQVAVNIQRGIAQGQDRITVQLRPAELGRVEVKMEMAHDGKMNVVVAAERPETLDMLRQDSRSLIQALNEAGMQADENSLNFQLQEQGDQNASSGNGSNGSGSGGDADEGIDPLIETGFQFEETGGFDDDGRLDVRI